MSSPERHILAAADIRAMLPEGLDTGEPRLRVVANVVRETTELLDGPGARCRRLILLVSPLDARALASLPASCREPPLRWAAMLFDRQPGGTVASELGALLGPSMAAYRVTAPTLSEMSFLIDRTWEALELWSREADETGRQAAELSSASSDLEALVRIGQSLSQEKDQERLLRAILSTSKEITGADAGSISLVEKDERGTPRLRFKYSHTFSRDLPFEEQVMPLNTKSVAGYVAATGRVLNLPDAYKLDPSLPYSFNPSFDRNFGYRTRSMLVVPMRNHVDEVIGVIQLINRKESRHEHQRNTAYELVLRTPEDYETVVVPFQPRYEGLMQAVASQAAIAIENNRMIAQIQSQFENFVRASVAAIESRDPPTSGHSFRVSQMCLNTARAINRRQDGVFAGVSFPDHALRELELAGLLHDFGKVYLDAGVFVKAKKLYPGDLAYLMLRLEYVYRSIELERTRKVPGTSDPDPATDRRLQDLREIMATVRRLNEPTVLQEDRDTLIGDILRHEGELRATDLAGNPLPLLTEAEATNLRIRWGTLNAQERKIIESHVTHTYSFVEKIPWPAEFAAIPRIARSHHEKLDGSGYPDGLKGKDAVPLGARIMAVADVYDALAASDRPYKRAVPLDRVMEVLREEAAAGKLDPDIVEIFIAEKAYEVARNASGGGGERKV